MKTQITILLMLVSFFGYSQSIERPWKTIDDETGKPRSIVKIESREGKYYGTIVRLFRAPDEEQDPVCDKCPGDRFNQKVIGMEIISDMIFDKDDNEYSDGEILDPESGNVYDCKLWIDETGNLKVRGYIMFLFRTQTWLPYEE